MSTNVKATRAYVEGMQSRITELEAEREELLKHVYRLHTELSSHQSVLYQLGRAGEVTTAYGEDGRKILDSVPTETVWAGKKAVYG